MAKKCILLLGCEHPSRLPSSGARRVKAYVFGCERELTGGELQLHHQAHSREKL